MPVLILAISVNLDELLEYCCLTSITFLSKSSRVMIMAVYVAFMLVIAVRRPKNSGTDRASEMLNVIFALERGYV